jgi:mannose-6-phosphate isomerase-like protein (cupin superfamily)
MNELHQFHWSFEDIAKGIPGRAGELSTTDFEHGTLKVKLYGPRGIDPQTPHLQDEIYVIVSGNGHFVRENSVVPFAVGDVLFAPAGAPHHFEDFSEDFYTWVFFYGPEGGEAPE